jgi:hypothetical protein
MSNESITFAEIDAKAAFERFLPLAMSIHPDSVRAFRGDALVAYHNVKAGAVAVLEREEEVKKGAPMCDTALVRALPNLALAVQFASQQVNRSPEATELRTLYPRVARLRRKMLASAVALAECGIFPERDVDAIRRGRGKIDGASDLVQLADLFQKHKTEAQGKHAIGENEIAQAAQLGTRALTILKPGAVPRAPMPSAALLAAIDQRDRLWTLLVRHHEDHLWRAGAWLFGSDVDDHVPPLLSRRVSHKEEEEEDTDVSGTAPVADA